MLRSLVGSEMCIRDSLGLLGFGYTQSNRPRNSNTHGSLIVPAFGQKWEGKIVFSSSGIQSMHTQTLVGSRVCTNSRLSFSTTVKLDFLGTTCTGLTHWLSKIGQMIPLSNSFIISPCTASCMSGFSLHCGPSLV